MNNTGCWSYRPNVLSHFIESCQGFGIQIGYVFYWNPFEKVICWMLPVNSTLANSLKHSWQFWCMARFGKQCESQGPPVFVSFVSVKNLNELSSNFFPWHSPDPLWCGLNQRFQSYSSLFLLTTPSPVKLNWSCFPFCFHAWALC